MQKVTTLVIYRSWKEAFRQEELNALSHELSQHMTDARVEIKTESQPDGEELQVQVRPL